MCLEQPCPGEGWDRLSMLSAAFHPFRVFCVVHLFGCFERVVSVPVIGYRPGFKPEQKEHEARLQERVTRLIRDNFKDGIHLLSDDDIGCALSAGQGVVSALGIDKRQSRLSRPNR